MKKTSKLNVVLRWACTACVAVSYMIIIGNAYGAETKKKSTTETIEYNTKRYMNRHTFDSIFQHMKTSKFTFIGAISDVEKKMFVHKERKFVLASGCRVLVCDTDGFYEVLAPELKLLALKKAAKLHSPVMATCSYFAPYDSESYVNSIMVDMMGTYLTAEDL